MAAPKIAMTWKGVNWSFRLTIVCLVALSVSLPMAWISLGKLLLFFGGLIYIVKGEVINSSESELVSLRSTQAIVVSTIVMMCSLFWTTAEMDLALLALVKHGKLLMIVLIFMLIKTREEAMFSLRIFAFGQFFLLISSWALFFGIPVPWATSSVGKYAIFSSYLDQSIMFSASSAIFWHLRNQTIWPTYFGLAAALLGILGALMLLEGRTGYVAALAVIALGAMWAVPRRFRLFGLTIAPIAVGAMLFLFSAQFQSRILHISDGSSNYLSSVNTFSEEGWRLNAWRISIDAMKKHPFSGTGVGSWKAAAESVEGERHRETLGPSAYSNPHQEFLLWGVELGISGVLLLIGICIAIASDAKKAATGNYRATLSVLACLFVACMFNSALYDDLLGDYFCITLGLLFALGRHSRSEASLPGDLNVVRKAVV